MMKKIVLLSFVLVTCLTSCQAQIDQSDDVRNNIKARIDQGSNAGIVVAIADAKGVRYHSAGVKSMKTKEPVDEHSVFEIGSISKTFTGIILADKVIKGEMKLDDPLQQYLPKDIIAPTRNGETIRLVQMANHTSSLPRMPDNFKPTNPNNPFADYSEKQLYDFLVNHHLTRDIGSQYEYSNYAVGLLGHTLAAKSGMTYEQLLIKVIADPLNLPDTRITLTPAMKKNLATGHAGGAEVENWDIPTLAGAGAIRSTAVDMIRYVMANMGTIESKLYPAMKLSHTNTRADNAAPMVGLGWHIIKAGNKEIIWHNGGTGGYRTFAGFVKGENKGVVVLCNSNESIDDIGLHLLNPESPLTPVNTAKPIDVDAAILETYVGKYEIVPTFALTVTREGTQLNVQATAQAKFPVFATAENEFFYKVVNAQLTFNKNKEGVVESLTLHQNGQHMVGKRVP